MSEPEPDTSAAQERHRREALAHAARRAERQPTNTDQDRDQQGGSR